MGKLASNRRALALFTFSYLDPNGEKLSAATVDGNSISVESTACGTYPLSRPLAFYVKKAHISVIPGMKEFLAEWTSDRASGAGGLLFNRGLIPLRT